MFYYFFSAALLLFGYFRLNYGQFFDDAAFEDFDSNFLSKREAQAMNRILNGMVIEIEERPYQVALIRAKNNRRRVICGGVLVRPNVVFTAAHCTHMNDFQPRPNLQVLVGANTLNDPKGKIHQIRKVVKHPEHTFRTFDNDFSVVILKKPVEFSSRVQTIKVSLGDHLGGSPATISGWGQTELGSPSKHLRSAEVTIAPWNMCQKYFPKPLHPTITRNMVCVLPNKASTYYGDSGGPLVIDDKLVGLVSFGRTVGGDKKTTVFTRVKNFLDFADEVISDSETVDSSF